MSQGSRTVSDAITIMRQVLSRQNTNDANSTNAKFLSYMNDFISLSMPNDLRVVEEFGTLSFNIDGSTNGVYTFNDVGASSDFMSLSNEGFISLLAPQNESVSWNQLQIFRDPASFYSIWGINNTDILVTGYPTAMLSYGNEFVFRTIPDTDYLIEIYGYKKRNDFDDVTDEIPFDYWLRYLAYGAALDYASDYNYGDQAIARIEKGYKREKKRMLTNAHNRLVNTRGFPSF